MPKYLISANYSSGSWARMLQSAGDRTSAVKAVADAAEGDVEAIYWGLESRSAFIICDLPDAVTAAAVVTAAGKTGAFTSVQVQELLNQQQLNELLLVAKDVSHVYVVPGKSAMELIRNSPDPSTTLLTAPARRMG